MENLIREHARRYPLLGAQDVYKLLHQSAFAGGHMIRDEAACLAYLQQEFAASPKRDLPLFEPIGGGLCRVHLDSPALCAEDLPLLGRLFIHTAAHHAPAPALL